jgi:peroxiredoxin
MALQVGDQAPSFALYDTEKNLVQLSDFQGKNVVLLFFPMAFTGVCTAELCAMRDNIADYEHVNAQVLAVSVDSPFSLGQFKKDQGYNFPLLSDFNKTVSTAYGTLYEQFVMDMKGVSKRSAFVIDGEGIIRYAEVLENAGELPNFENVQQALAEIQESVA